MSNYKTKIQKETKFKNRSEARKRLWKERPELKERLIAGSKKYWSNPKNRKKHRRRMLGEKNPNWFKRAPNRKFPLTRTKLQKLAVKELKSSREIAKIYNLHCTTILAWMKRWHIPILQEKKLKMKILVRERHPSWKGGKITQRGYLYTKISGDYPDKNRNGYVTEHKLVMEKKLKRYLKKEEQIHHLNGDKLDNRVENLMLFPNAGIHSRFHKFLDTLAIFLLGLSKNRPIFNFGKEVRIFDKQLKKIFSGRSILIRSRAYKLI